MFRDSKKPFMDIAKNYMCRSLMELAKVSNGREPTLDEFIGKYLESYRAAHKANPSLGGFKDEKHFEKWIEKFERLMRRESDYCFKKASKAYYTCVEYLNRN